MILKDFLGLLREDMPIKIWHDDLNHEYIYVGKAVNCPYWIANDFKLGYYDVGWFIDKNDNHLVICVCD
ncbi:MAG: hypothetical protein ABRQ27_12285 [Clostridiaceae bacterium]